MDYGAKIGRMEGTEGTNEGKRKPAGGTSGHTIRGRERKRRRRGKERPAGVTASGSR